MPGLAKMMMQESHIHSRVLRKFSLKRRRQMVARSINSRSEVRFVKSSHFSRSLSNSIELTDFSTENLERKESSAQAIQALRGEVC